MSDDATSPLQAVRPPRRGPTRRDRVSWQQRCETLEAAVRALLRTARLTDAERQAVRTIVARFSGVDVTRRDRRDRLAAERRNRLRASKGGA